jgi:hypothetical protein
MRPFQVVLMLVAFIPANTSSSDDKRPEGTGDKPKVVTEQVRCDRFPGGEADLDSYHRQGDGGQRLHSPL